MGIGTIPEHQKAVRRSLLNLWEKRIEEFMKKAYYCREEELYKTFSKQMDRGNISIVLRRLKDKKVIRIKGGYIDYTTE